jgi:hypothetical protein
VLERGTEVLLFSQGEQDYFLGNHNSLTLNLDIRVVRKAKYHLAVIFLAH